METRSPICCTFLPAESAPFSSIALAVSAAVSLGGIFIGWLIYRRSREGEKDPLEILLGPVHGFLQAGCRFDDLYRIVFVAPVRWIANVAVSDWIDLRILDGALGAIARGAGGLGRALRQRIDLPLINGGADKLAQGTKRAGGELRTLQSGRVQEYLLIGLITFAACGAALLYRMMTMP
jgi:NADH:ubiquinone oxidoreductase subunit 5 (subunit L)/multisubunit Na+/H+ antiporter MnhA subunit